MKLLLVLLLCCEVLYTVNAQYRAQCSGRILSTLTDRFFDALRKVESDGDLCKISADGNESSTELGPYQISEDYYDEAVDFNPTLKSEGLNPATIVYS